MIDSNVNFNKVNLGNRSDIYLTLLHLKNNDSTVIDVISNIFCTANLMAEIILVWHNKSEKKYRNCFKLRLFQR